MYGSECVKKLNDKELINQTLEVRNSSFFVALRKHIFMKSSTWTEIQLYAWLTIKKLTINAWVWALGSFVYFNNTWTNFKIFMTTRISSSVWKKKQKLQKYHARNFLQFQFSLPLISWKYLMLMLPLVAMFVILPSQNSISSKQQQPQSHTIGIDFLRQGLLSRIRFV